MRPLLDTCALIALAGGRLSSRVLRGLRSAEHIIVSVVSPWEIALKVESGKLTLRESPLSWFNGLVERYVLKVETVDAAMVCAAASLPRIHRDPFDRIFVATAQRHGLTIITSDRHIPEYPGVKTLW